MRSLDPGWADAASYPRLHPAPKLDSNYVKRHRVLSARGV